MRLCVIGDVHFSQYSSILRKQGIKYTQRLENLIESLNWAEGVAIESRCDAIVYLGDFFDKPTLTDAEITALREINWSNLPHYFIVGNHESSVHGLEYSSTKALERDGFHIIHSITRTNDGQGTEIILLPYRIEDDRKPLAEDIGPHNVKRVVFSHNDIKGISYGRMVSEIGYGIDDIKSSCELFINGHLHNGCFVNNDKSIINLGNLTGANFSEDALNHEHRIMVLDTYDLSYEFVVNPHAYNFVQLSFNDVESLDRFKPTMGNMVINIKCPEDIVSQAKAKMDALSGIVPAYKITATRPTSNGGGQLDISVGSINYLDKFNKFVVDTLGDTQMVREEIGEIIR